MCGATNIQLLDLQSFIITSSFVMKNTSIWLYGRATTLKKCSRNVMVSEEGKRYNLWPTSWPAEMSGVREREIINSTYSAFTNVSVCSCANRE